MRRMEISTVTDYLYAVSASARNVPIGLDLLTTVVRWWIQEGDTQIQTGAFEECYR